MIQRLRPYAQLVRLPNVFTAFADIGMAALVAGALPERWPAFVSLLMASGCLYCAGMVWNDFFDIDQDRRERPFRPLPSGRVSPRAALSLGIVLLAAGVALANGVVVAFVSSWAAGVISILLVGMILAYDAFLKRTWFGPLAMGSCRFLNVLFGLTLVSQSLWPTGFYLALIVGVYIVGVTWFARSEARASKSGQLIAASSVMLLALLLALPAPVVLKETGWPHDTSPLFPYLLVAFGFLLGFPVCRAIVRPEPAFVQRAVKTAVLGLVVLDAVLATAAAGTIGLVLLLLLVPALFLGRWLYST